MLPKKAKDFKKPVAEELNLPEDLVDKLVDMYWETLRKEIINMDKKAINIPNLGSFKVKYWKIDEAVGKYAKVIEKLNGKFTGYNLKKDLEERIIKLNNIKKIVAEEHEKFNKIREQRYGKKNKNDMEEPSSDMGGIQESDIQN